MFFLFYHGVCSHRSEDAEAFEVQDGGKSTGIFTKYLNKHVLKPERVTYVLEQVSEGECCYQYSSVPKLRGLPHYLYCLQLPSKGAVRSTFSWAKNSHFKRNSRDREFHMKAKRFPHADFATGSSWSQVFIVLSTESCLVWKWILCELFFIHCTILTIDNGLFAHKIS